MDTVLELRVLVSTSDTRDDAKDRLELTVQRALGVVFPAGNLFIERIEREPAA